MLSAHDTFFCTDLDELNGMKCGHQGLHPCSSIESDPSLDDLIEKWDPDFIDNYERIAQLTHVSGQKRKIFPSSFLYTPDDLISTDDDRSTGLCFSISFFKVLRSFHLPN